LRGLAVRCLTFAVSAVIGLAASSAAGDDGDVSRRWTSRCYGAGELLADGRALWIDGRRATVAGTWLGTGVGGEAGCSGSVGAAWFGLLALGRVAIGERLIDREDFGHVDIAIGPELRWRTTRPGTSVHVSLPIGYTRMWIEPSFGRAVVQKYELGEGINVELLAGFAQFWGHHGFQIDVVHALYWVSIDHSERLAAQSGPVVRERYRVLEYAMGVAAGYAYRF
jgi:hypothetical protein